MRPLDYYIRVESQWGRFFELRSELITHSPCHRYIMVAFGNAIFAHFVRKRYSFAAICTHFREYAICAYGARVMPTTIKDSHRILTIVITTERGSILMSKNANPAGRVVTLSNGKPSGIHIASRRDISRPQGISRTEGASRKLKGFLAQSRLLFYAHICNRFSCTIPDKNILIILIFLK